MQTVFDFRLLNAKDFRNKNVAAVEMFRVVGFHSRLAFKDAAKKGKDTTAEGFAQDVAGDTRGVAQEQCHSVAQNSVAQNTVTQHTQEQCHLESINHKARTIYTYTI